MVVSTQAQEAETGQPAARFQFALPANRAAPPLLARAEHRLRPSLSEPVIDRRYRVLARVGSGATSDVYCAEDLTLGRKIAIKLLHTSLADDNEIVASFQHEASSAADLHHPHIVSVYDRGEWNGTHYIAMQYVPGRSLRSLIREQAPLAPAQAIDLAGQLAEAARYIHRRGIVHRDLKPSNAIVDAGHLTLIDFGIAIIPEATTAQDGAVVGTPEYMSPEQAQGHAVGIGSDLYSIGIILYELLTGQVPFAAETVVTILYKHVTERPVPPIALNPAVTRELDAIVSTALEKRPASRFTDADALIAALGQAARTLPARDARDVTATADHVRSIDRSSHRAATQRWGLRPRLWMC
jgi:serine/threonine protein kinase